MKKILLLTSFLFTICLNGFGQKPGTADYLLVKNGFKIFKLGTDINNYSKYVRLGGNDGGTKEYEVTDPKFLTIGDDIKIDKIKLRVSQGDIYAIKVVVDDPYKIRFYAALKAAYGNHYKKKTSYIDL